MKFKEIILPVESSFQKFRREFSDAVISEMPLLTEVFKHIQSSQGKQIRPVLILLSAEICGKITDRTYRSAVMTEMLHLATLLHDDVIDEAQMRRNQLSVNAKWNNKVAILVGDYLFAETLKIAAKHDDYGLLNVMCDAVKKVSEGELIQMQHTANQHVTEEIYNDIISKKTASLFSAACACGALSANTTPENMQTFHQIGWHLGMAFQIKDDLLDLLPNAESGKIKGNDIREQKYTLPVIHFLKTQSENVQKHALDILQNHYENPDNVQQLSQDILNSESLFYTETKIAEHIENAKVLLDPFNNGIGKTTLQNLMTFFADRNH